MTKDDINYKVLRIASSVAAVYLVVRIAIDFSLEDWSKMIYKVSALAFVGAVYFVTKRKLDKDSEQ